MRISEAVSDAFDSGEVSFGRFGLAAVADQPRANFAAYTKRQMLLMRQELATVRVGIPQFFQLP